MKKFMIFFLMAFLLLSNSHSYAEKLNIDGVEATNDAPDFLIYPGGNQFMCAWTGNPASQIINFFSPMPGVAASYQYHCWYVNDVLVAITEGWADVVGSAYTFSAVGRPAGTYIVRQEAITGLGAHYYSNDVAVYILDEPSVSIAGPTSGCVGEAVTLTAVANDVPAGYTLLWYRNGVSTGVITQTYTYNIPALSLPSSPQNDEITVGLSYSGCTEKLSPVHYVLNMPVPVVSISSPWSHCDGDYVTVSADATTTGGIQPTRWTWVGDIYGTGGSATAYSTTNSIKIFGTGNFTVSAQYDNASCNSGTATFTVNETVPTTLSINTTSTNVCEEGQFSLTAAPALAVPTGTLFTWYRNGVEIPGQNLISISEIISTPGTYIYRVKATYPDGCVTTLSTATTVTVHPAPELTITGTPMFCSADADVSLTVNNYHTGSPTFAWYRDDLNQSVSTATITQNDVPAREYPYIYKVIVTDDATFGACVVTKEFAVVINPTPSIQVTVDDAFPCVNGQITFTPTMGYSTDFTYQWVEGATPIAGASSYIYNTSYGSTSTRFIGLRVTSTAIPTCTAVSNLVGIYPTDVPTTPVISPAASNVCLGGQVNLATTVAVPGGIYTWYRNGVEISGVTGSSLSEILPTAGTYTYTVNVRTSHSGCVSANSTAATITVHTPEVVTISGTPIFCTDPATVTLNANPATGATYQWYQDNVAVGTNSPAFSASIASRDLPYIFRVQMTSTAANGGCVSTSADYPVIINDNPEIEIAAEATSVCVGGTITITPLAPYSQNVSYAWYRLGTGTPIATTYELNIPAGTSATYYLVITSNNAPSCVATSNQVTITVVAASAVTLAPTVAIAGNIICEGGQFTLQANTTSTNPVYTWYRNGVLIAGANLSTLTESPLPVDDDLTVYNYQVYVTSSEGCVTTATYSVSVRRNPIVEIITNPNVCENLPTSATNIEVTARVNGLSGYIPGTFTWYEDGLYQSLYTGSTLQTQKPTRNYSYTYQVEYTNTYGCSAFSNVEQVMVHPRPQIEILAEETPVCIGGNIELSVNLSNYSISDEYTYQWYLADTATIHAIAGATLPTLTVNPAATTNYRVVVTQTTSGCVGENTITITVNPDPVITGITIVNPTLCEGGQIEVTAATNPTIIEGAVYTWYKNGAVMNGFNGASFTESPIAVDNDVTVYSYGVSVAYPVSGCQSNILTAEQQVTVYGNPTVVIEGNPLVCDDSTFTLTAHVNDTIPGTTVTYQWRRFNQDIPGATQQSITATEPFQFGNTYMYTVVVNTEYTNGTIGCVRESDPFYIAVGENPHIDILASDTVACLNGEVTLTAVLGNAYLDNIFVTWYKNGEEIYGAHQLTYVATITGTATYYAVVSASGCTATTESIEIHLINTPVVGAVIASNNVGGSAICEGGEIEVTAYLYNGVNNYIDSTATYTWFRNGFLMEGVTGPWFSESLHAIDGDTTHYTYAVIVNYPTANCVSEIAFSNTITVTRNPIVIINGLHEICQSTDGQPNLYLSAYINGISNPDNTTIFKWYKNGVYQNNPNFGLYYTENLGLSYQAVTYMVEIINGNGCSAFSDPFEVFVHPTPVANITVDQATVCNGGQVTLTANLNDYNEDEYIYQWYLNGTSVANVIPGATQLTYTTPALTTTGTYYFRIIQRHSGCNDLTSQVITVLPDPQITNIQVSATAICDGGEVVISANTSNVNGTATYTWFRNGILLEGITGATFTQSLQAIGNDVTTYTYTAFVTTNIFGCQSAIATAPVITVTPNPTVVIAGEPIVCEGVNNIVLNANSVPATGLQYQWFLNNVAITDATSATLTTTQPASTTPYVYTVQVSGATGCVTMSNPYNVTVNASPIVNVAATENNICVGGEVTLTATLVDWNAGMLTYQWYHNNEIIPGATNLTYTTSIDNVGYHNYQIVVTQITSGCTGTASTMINVAADPQITGITISEPFICEGGQVTVTATATGIIGTPVYTWFRNGILMPGVNGASFTESPVAVDGDVTTYTYSAIVTSSASGCQSAEVNAPVLTVYGNPVVAITGDMHICENEMVNLMAFVDHVSDNVGNLTYTWYESGQERDNLVNGIPANSQIYTEYWYPNDQAYVFTVRVTRENGCTTLSQPFNVYVHENPVVNVTATEETVCEGGQVTMTANLDNYNTTDITYQWFTVTTQENQVQVSATEFITVIDTIINNIPGATLSTYTTNVNTTSQYGVLVTQTISGCTATDRIIITANPIPVVTSITVAQNATICEGGQVTLTAHIQGGVAGGEVYTWYRNGIIIPGANTASITESPLATDGNVTIYTYNVTVAQTAAACQSILNADVAAQVTVNPNPSVTISGDPIICETANIQLLANLNDVNNNTGMTYEWRLFNQTLGITTPELSIARPASDNPYIFTVLVTNQYGCQVESTPYYVYVNSNPVVQVTATEATICNGGTTTLTANLGDYNVPNLVFAWTENGVTIPGATTNQVTVNPTATSVYTVSVVQTTSACSATGSITVTVVPDPIITSVTVNESQVCEGGQITVTAAIEGGIQGGEVFTWFRNGIIVPNVTGNTFTESPLVIGDDVTIYNYSVQVTQTASGCQSVISQPVAVTVYPLATVQVMVTGNTTICEGGSVQLTANVNPTTTNTTYQWFVDNVLIPGATAATYTVTDAQARETAYQYTVLVSQYIGCNVTSAPQAITVVADPVVNVTVNNPSICVGGTATLTANVQGGVENINGIGAFTFNWYSTTSPITSLGTNATLEVTGVTPQLETYWVVVTSPYGCSTTAYYYNHEVVADPTVAIAIGNGYSTQVCEGGQTMLVANVAGGLGQPMYQWYKNGILLVGETNASIMTTALYSTQTADYTVNVTMTGVGCNATANFNAHNIVVASPVVAITGNTNTCPGGTVTLVASVTGGVTNDTYTYQWFKVSNGIPTAINGAINATYTTSPLLLGDSYEYYVQISSFVSGCSATSGTVQANVVAEPTVTISGANTVCQGGVLTLTANVNGGVPGETYVYTWTYQQGTQTGIYQTTTNVFQLPTTLVANDVASPYVFNVTVMSANYHCDAVSASHIINIYPQPQATITVDNQAVCLGGSVTFTANVTPVGTYNYQWTVNGVVQGNNTPSITRNNLPAGVTNVTLVATPNNSNAACTAVASKSVTVVADPVVTVNSNVTTMCAGGTINLGVQTINLDTQVATGNYTYQWRENGVEVSNVIGSTFNKNLTTTGTYTYALRITQNDNLGCASNWSNEITVTVAPQPVATINPAGLGLLDICSGGEVNLNATVTNANPVHGTMNYTWYSNNTNTGVTTNPYVQTLNTVGTYNYYAKLTPSGFACNPVNTNVLTYNVVADPTWTNISVQYPEICAGETVQLSAGVQGGVEDGSGNTNGTIQWMVWAENGNPQPVLGGLGGVSYDTPTGTGNYFYQPTYSGQLGDGCNILVNPVTPVVVNERPTATFANGDGSIVCGNDPNSFATLTVELTGTAPFTFTLNGSNGYSQNFYTSLNTFYIYLNPNTTGSYTIANLHDANCEAVAYPAPVTVIVSHIEVLDLLAEVCGETTSGTLPRVQMDVNIFSVAPGMEPTAFITFVNPSIPVMNTQSPIYTEGTRTYIEFAVPNTPGDYEVIITIDGCNYPATVRVLAGQYNFGVTEALIQQRWDDVVVVNNNPATNGNHNFVSFQWYKNGVLIPGATKQYYQEVGGLNGEYAVELIAQTDSGLVTYKTCDMFFVSENLMKVYPVPARTQESVTIEAKLTDEQLKGAVLDIYDAKGAFVKQVEVNDIIIRIDGFTTPGAYFGRITTGTNEIKTVKFVIVK